MKAVYILLIVLISCSQSKETPFLKITDEELRVDSDGDGVGDILELDIGRDPHLANVPNDEQLPPPSVTLISKNGERDELSHPGVSRSLRNFFMSVLKEPLPSYTAIPLLNEQHIRLSSFQR